MSRILVDEVCKVFLKPVLFKRKNWLIRKLTKESISITIGRTVYLSDHFQGIITPELAMHESQHVADQCRYDPESGKLVPSLLGTLNFYLEYAFPFSITIPALIITPFISLMAFLIALGVFAVSIPLLPFLSWWRKRYELRGYTWNFLITEREYFAQTFSGWTYMRMDIKRDDRYYIDKMKENLINPDEIMQVLLTIWTKYNCQCPDHLDELMIFPV